MVPGAIKKREEGLKLIRFAIQLAQDQIRGGRHYFMENPLTSEAWKLPEMIKFLEEKEAALAAFHQCRFGLRSASGELHQKATKIATSSSELH